MMLAMSVNLARWHSCSQAKKAHLHLVSLGSKNLERREHLKIQESKISTEIISHLH